MPRMSTKPSEPATSIQETSQHADFFNADERVDDVIDALQGQWAAADQARGRTGGDVHPPSSETDLDDGASDEGAADPHVTPEAPDETGRPEESSSSNGDETVTEPQPTTYSLDGYTFTDEDLRAAISSHMALASLTPQQVEAVQRVLAGEDAPSPPSVTAPPVTPPAGTLPEDDDDEVLDPILAERIRRLEEQNEARIAALENHARSSVDKELNQRRSSALEDLNSASTEFALSRGITPLQVEQLHNSIADYGLVAAITRRRPNDPPKVVFAEALERAYRLEFFDSAVQSAAQTTLDASQDQMGEARDRKAKAARLSGPTGSVNRQLPSVDARVLKGAQQVTDAIANIVREQTGS